MPALGSRSNAMEPPAQTGAPVCGAVMGSGSVRWRLVMGGFGEGAHMDLVGCAAGCGRLGYLR